MQRLEVSGAVRPIYGSLGVKRLNKLTALYGDRYECLAFEGHTEDKLLISCSNIKDVWYYDLVKYGAVLREILESVKFNDGRRRKILFHVRPYDDI